MGALSVHCASGRTLYVTVNGLSFVTSADNSSVGSSTHREPVGDAGSGTGRNELGRTSELMAAFTGDWSDSRWELKPGPIVSMAMMICVAFGGGGTVVSVVSVLWGAGGGLTVQDDATSISAEIAATMRRVPDTLFRVSTPSEGEEAQASGRTEPGQQQLTSHRSHNRPPSRPAGGRLPCLRLGRVSLM